MVAAADGQGPLETAKPVDVLPDPVEAAWFSGGSQQTSLYPPDQFRHAVMVTHEAGPVIHCATNTIN